MYMNHIYLKKKHYLNKIVVKSKVKAPNNLVPDKNNEYHLNFSQERERNHKMRESEGEKVILFWTKQTVRSD